jgi:hypothetical protein
MGVEAILREIEVLYGVCTRLQGLADEHVPISVELVAIAESIRSAAVLLALIVATKDVA